MKLVAGFKFPQSGDIVHVAGRGKKLFVVKYTENGVAVLKEKKSGADAPGVSIGDVKVVTAA